MASAEIQAQPYGDPIAPGRKAAGRALIWSATLLLALIVLLQALDTAGQGQLHFETWRPTLYAKGSAGSVAWRRRDALAGVLEDHLPADAPGLGDCVDPAHHLQAEARLH